MTHTKHNQNQADRQPGTQRHNNNATVARQSHLWVRQPEAPTVPTNLAEVVRDFTVGVSVRVCVLQLNMPKHVWTTKDKKIQKTLKRVCRCCWRCCWRCCSRFHRLLNSWRDQDERDKRIVAANWLAFYQWYFSGSSLVWRLNLALLRGSFVRPWLGGEKYAGDIHSFCYWSSTRETAKLFVVY